MVDGNLHTSKAPKAAPIGLPEFVRIQLEDNESIPPTGLYLGLNGHGYLLRPGIPVNVPRGLCEILDNAVQSIAIINPETRKVDGFRDRRRYPYNVLPPEEPNNE